MEVPPDAYNLSRLLFGYAEPAPSDFIARDPSLATATPTKTLQGFPSAPLESGQRPIAALKGAAFAGESVPAIGLQRIAVDAPAEIEGGFPATRKPLAATLCELRRPAPPARLPAPSLSRAYCRVRFSIPIVTHRGQDGFQERDGRHWSSPRGWSSRGLRAFEHLGGVAATCLYDNMKTVVDRWEGGGPVYNVRFLAFAAHYGRGRACAAKIRSSEFQSPLGLSVRPSTGKLTPSPNVVCWGADYQ
jgi:hypothetical protein